MFKRLLAITVAVLMMSSALTCFANGEDGRLLGDINGDGDINAYDYIYCKRAVLKTIKLNDVQSTSADVNQDGNINSYDYILIKRHVMKTFVIVQPEPAPEPTYVPNILSAGKQYTVSVDPSSSYPDSYNCELTDGVFDVATGYYAGSFCGFNNTVDITVDLGSDGKNIRRFEISYLSTNDAGINIPKSIKVKGSTNGTNWDELGKMTIPAYEESKVMRATLEMGGDVEYRYICFTVERISSWVFIDEIFVYSSVMKEIFGDGGETTESYFNDPQSDSIITANRKKASTGVNVDLSLGKTLVSKGCSYTVDCMEYDWRSGKNDTLLTDGGITGAPFELEEWVGMSMADASSVSVDLGKVRKDIFAFELNCFNRAETGINLPVYCDISISNDGKSFSKIGRVYSIISNQENYAYSLVLNQLVSARYVRFSLAKGTGYCWVEEAAVYANYKEEVKMQALYGELDFPTTDVLKYWSSSDSDYNNSINLLSGLGCQFTSDAFIESETGSKNNYSEDSGLLTDGKTTESLSCYNGIWHQFNGGNARNVYFDFGAVSSVSQFSMRLLKRVSWAIYLPESISLILSENGKDWYIAGQVSPTLKENEGITTATIKLSKAYRARYVLIRFDTVAHVFTDEMILTGQKNVSGASTLNGLTKYVFPDPEDGKYGYMAPSADVLGGVKDVCLMYHNTGVMDEEFLLPYVAYVDEDGKIVDTMFDGYLFLPSTAPLPSGGRPYGTTLASDWNYLFDEIFASGKNFDALDKTAEKVNKALGQNNKLKVYVTIPHMDDTLVDFGDIDFDGKNDSLTTLENRVYVARYYAERVIKEFKSRNYKNLELHGFYWFHESISGGDVETSKAVNKMFDEIGYQLFWIPYFNAGGYSRWEEFGFDVGCLQPNYAFSLEVPESRLQYASELAQRYGMCIELEIDAAASHDIRYFKKYMGYLYYGKIYGYMDNAIHMYYQGAADFGNYSRSKNDRLRLIYDYTYQFMKGTLETTPDVVSPKKFSLSVNKPYKNSLSASKNGTDIYRIGVSPAHGTVSIADDGTFVYYPNKDFKGTDTFTYQYSNYLGWSEECTVTVNVQ